MTATAACSCWRPLSRELEGPRNDGRSFVVNAFSCACQSSYIGTAEQHCPFVMTLGSEARPAGGEVSFCPFSNLAILAYVRFAPILLQYLIDSHGRPNIPCRINSFLQILG
jgi:hypothetical protein